MPPGQYYEDPPFISLKGPQDGLYFDGGTFGIRGNVANMRSTAKISFALILCVTWLRIQMAFFVVVVDSAHMINSFTREWILWIVKHYVLVYSIQLFFLYSAVCSDCLSKARVDHSSALSLCRSAKAYSWQSRVKLFDTLVSNSVLYSSPVWSAHFRPCNNLEVIHTAFLRQLI